VTALEQKMIAAGGSLGGAKPKALIQIDDEQWVIKFFNGEPDDIPLIEHASMTLAKQAGINTAATQVISLLGENAIAIKRFDRSNATRLHCISAATALQAACAQGQEPVQVIKVVNDWRAHFKTCGVSDADIDSLGQRIDGAFLLEQRKAF
jgi:serine/threonine-protein kinase HipA